MKAAVYAGTRNIYQDMIPAAKSLLIHSDVDKIYFLIEDDQFPYELPPEIECINVSDQKWFDNEGPNYRSKWSYMILLRAAYTKLFPDLDKILSLDVDTIVNENVSELWNINLDGYYLAAVKEPKFSTNRYTYINIGVTLFNLKKLREDKKDDEIIYALNNYYYTYPEQTCYANYCQGHILTLPANYNISTVTQEKITHRKIIHYAAIKSWTHLPLVKKYKEASIQRNIQDTFGLDIIIPTYNNIKELDLTLSSIYHEEIFKFNFPINITVVDDCSNIDYTDIIIKYPKVNFIYLDKNSGPGIARQKGIEATKMPYIMFIDTGDYLLSKYAIIQIILTILSNTVPYIYHWRYLNECNHHYCDYSSLRLHGAVFKREFLELYNITFSTTAPYANEDIGFYKACALIIKNLSRYDHSKMIQEYDTPIYMYTYNKNSITNKNNKEFLLLPQIHGIVKNTEHAIYIGEKNGVPMRILWEDISQVMVRLYYDFWYLMKNTPESGQKGWDIIREYYFKLYKPYNNGNNNTISIACSIYRPKLEKLGVKRFNFIHFINDIENNQYVPDLYFDLF